MKTLAPRQVLLLHHNDTDGLCAGHICLKFLERSGIRVRRFCLEKPYPPVVKAIGSVYAAESDVVFIADFGSGMIDILCSIFRSIPIFLLDHHTVVGDKSALHLINPTVFGLSGGLDGSAASVSACFAQTVSKFSDDLLPVGLLGAFGDGQLDTSGRFCGLNASIYATCAKLGLVRGEGASLEFNLYGWKRAYDLKQWLDALGSFGYLKKGPDIALKALQDGFDETSIAIAAEFLRQFDEALEVFLKANDLTIEGALGFFSLSDHFTGYGVKTVGLICERILKRSPELKNIYLFGFQAVPSTIPGVGEVEPAQLKVSGRVGADRSVSIDYGQSLGLHQLMPEAARAVGGFSDACHPHSAAVTIPENATTRFLSYLEERIREQR